MIFAAKDSPAWQGLVGGHLFIALAFGQFRFVRWRFPLPDDRDEHQDDRVRFLRWMAWVALASGVFLVVNSVARLAR